MRKHHGHAGNEDEEGRVFDSRDTDANYLKTLGYERRDVVIPTLSKWIGGLFVFIFGALGLAFAVYALFVSDEAQDKQTLALRAATRDVPRDLPKVQAYPRRDMVLFRREEEQKVHGFGWVNEGKGVARIPVETAIEELATGGFGVPAAGQRAPGGTGMSAPHPAPPPTAPPGPAPAAPGAGQPGAGQSHGSEFNR